MATKVDIFNLAIITLGGKPITSTTQNDRAAIVMNTVYDMLRKAELRKKPAWNFSVKQVQLAASATDPLFDKAYSYPLPGDFLAMAPSFVESDYNDKDWIVQSGSIFTNYQAPLEIRYVYDVTDTSVMDPQFIVALAAKLASTCADAITQSNSKVQIADQAYKDAIAEARKANAFDNVPREFTLDPWFTVRL